ncbi:DNA sulfur modification protein DndD [Sharpea azabuensis]|uniref:DNA sulfur modification protein DndD n=1 Tax=Sharpea azabuensis TaxID=322505 RepID=UPI003CFD2B0E
MKISRLKLHNFGVYASDNEFVFRSDKPVVLIGGMNGRGKTTFLEAVLLALYGKNSFAYLESTYKSYGRYLNAHVNRADQSMQTYVELEFDLDKSNYIVRRAWRGDQKRTDENITVFKDGEKNDFLTQNWAMFIENVLPSGLSNFFFFDGEKIASIAEDDTSEQMKESIKSMLGISKLDHLENDLNRIIKQLGKETTSDKDMKQLESLKEKRNEARKSLEELDHDISDTRDKIEKTTKKLEELENQYIAVGGDIIKNRQELYTKRLSLKTQEQQNAYKLVEAAASDLPLLMVSDLLKNAAKEAEKENNQRHLRQTINKVGQMYSQYDAKSDDIEKFLDYLESSVDTSNCKPIYNLSDASLIHLKNLLEMQIITDKAETQAALKQKSMIIKKLNEIDSYLSVEINEKEINEIYAKIKDTEQTKRALELQLEKMLASRSSKNGEALHSNTEFSKFVESILDKLEMNDDADRIMKYANQAIKIIQVYKVRLQELKLGRLAETMTNCYKRLANKKNMIQEISMNTTTLDLIYYNAEGEMVDKSSLSAGEKQLMVVSLLWSLAICSKKKLPVIIDTPLARLDSDHRSSLVTSYFPNASEQTIILSTDSEIDKHYYDMMADYIGDEYTLLYDDINKNTSVKKGYFNEV